MVKILNGMFYFLKFVLLLAAFGTSLYVLIAMYQRLEKDMINLIYVFIPYIVILVLFIINMFFRQTGVTKNVFYNITCCLVFFTIAFLALRSVFDVNMIYRWKNTYHINFNFYSDVLTFINVMIYGLCIANVFLMFSESSFKLNKKKEIKDAVIGKSSTLKKEKPVAVQLDDEETL